MAWSLVFVTKMVIKYQWLMWCWYLRWELEYNIHNKWRNEYKTLNYNNIQGIIFDSLWIIKAKWSDWYIILIISIESTRDGQKNIKSIYLSFLSYKKTLKIILYQAILLIFSQLSFILIINQK